LTKLIDVIVAIILIIFLASFAEAFIFAAAGVLGSLQVVIAGQLIGSTFFVVFAAAIDMLIETRRKPEVK